jgi:glycosyltransferase involved in cell wall biosynthesis
VSFVVPCYKLAHLLPDCVHSILSQTYGDLEVLIMDDCSPDHTAEVARSFRDRRVRHVRNDPNLGHLRNYNKGIGLARGEYVWLISADDYLRRPYVLARYVELLERRPEVGYAFCAGVFVRDGAETGPVGWAYSGDRDRVFPGHAWLKTLLTRNLVLAPSGLVRRACYDELGAFPLDLPYAGDWYLWCLFALHHDVAWFAEPMVCYRDHGLSMTSDLTQTKAAACIQEELAIPWRIKNRADAAGFQDVSRAALRSLAQRYVWSTGTPQYGMASPFHTLEQFEASLRANAESERERTLVRALVYEGLGNLAYARGEVRAASRFYEAALRERPWTAAVVAKRALLSAGPLGAAIRELIRAVAGGGREPS